MQQVDHEDIVDRYRKAAHALSTAIRLSDLLSSKFGLAYLDANLADDIAAELALRDACDDCLAELNAELLEMDVIPYAAGYYKLDALGMPRYYPGVEVESPL